MLYRNKSMRNVHGKYVMKVTGFWFPGFIKVESNTLPKHDTEKQASLTIKSDLHGGVHLTMADSRQREEVKRAGFRSSTKSSDYPPFPSLMDGRLWSKRMGHKALGKKPLTTVYGHWTSKTFPSHCWGRSVFGRKTRASKGHFHFPRERSRSDPPGALRQ